MDQKVLIIIIIINQFIILLFINNYCSATPENAHTYALIYFGILIFVGILQRICGKVVLTLTYRSGENLHKKLLSAVVGAKATFFDMTPSGRIMNRY